MTRVPSDRPGRLEPIAVAERVAESVRRHALAAAQASLRALRELVARVASGESAAERPTPHTPATPAAGAAPKTRVESARSPRPAPPAELLRDTTSLPTAYGSDRLVLLARDPHCLYAYWDLSDARCHAVRADAGSDQLRMVLRAYDVTQIAFDAAPPARFQDFAIAGGARSLYAYVGRPGACFVAEVGYLRPDGGFFALARSLPIWTPRTDQPGAAPGRWMTVGWTERRGAGEALPVATTGADAAAENATNEGRPSTRPTSPSSSWHGPSSAQRGSWSLVRGGLSTPSSPAAPPATSRSDS